MLRHTFWKMISAVLIICEMGGGGPGKSSRND